MTGEELKRRREALGLTRKQLGDRLGFATQTIGRWETGALRIKRPEALALALDALECECAQTPLPQVKILRQGSEKWDGGK
jgi:transcriptional regulator with XRE-family HTH domain